VCTKHVKDNFNNFLKDQGMKKQERKVSKREVFGDDGILKNSRSTQEMNDGMGHLAARYPTPIKKRLEKIIHLLEDQFRALDKPELLMQHALWTNNSESFNHVLKQETSWKSCQLPRLVCKLHDVAVEKYPEVNRCFIGLGEYQLAGEYKTFNMIRDDWLSKSAAQRSKHFKRFMSVSKNPGRMMSTDGKTTARAPLHKDRKAGQRRHPRADRTMRR
jgi:hypothetical protein